MAKAARKTATKKGARRNPDLDRLITRFHAIRDEVESMNPRKHELMNKVQEIFADHSRPNRIVEGIQFIERSGGNALVEKQCALIDEADAVLEELLAIPAKRWTERKVKVVAFLRHLEDPSLSAMDGIPDSQLARRCLLPFLQELAAAGSD